MLWEAGQDSPRASHSLLVALADESARESRTAAAGAELSIAGRGITEYL